MLRSRARQSHRWDRQWIEKQRELSHPAFFALRQNRYMPFATPCNRQHYVEQTVAYVHVNLDHLRGGEGAGVIAAARFSSCAPLLARRLPRSTCRLRSSRPSASLRSRHHFHFRSRPSSCQTRQMDQMNRLCLVEISLFVTSASMPVSIRSRLRTMAGESTKLTIF